MIHARDDYNRIQDPENKIGQDEPVFLIRAKDAVSPAAVRAWAELNWVAGGDELLTNAAYTQAQRMEEWQLKYGKKLADL